MEITKKEKYYVVTRLGLVLTIIAGMVLMLNTEMGYVLSFSVFATAIATFIIFLKDNKKYKD